MGEANKRGTYEQRREKAINKEEREKLNAMYWKSGFPLEKGIIDSTAREREFFGLLRIALRSNTVTRILV